ncbi:hypothetical protein EIN_296790 [Entamoeba invadens IP1]|uniref:Uncharacterized protein n=1 Tax=Entamoeba invadens IP1 TaxID=370355 RepID=L7FKA8_ENTIV|nr:hypothetical protein EIN_296790 [Entamoeba invadens IP1]ELP86359.1 hypothetical protein EIN_296790 [Entamoeba invadens IP1]|eukprot:XP_004185705.1 hypothetical protein EIN_296790 [Entamoeba invadens IP1]
MSKPTERRLDLHTSTLAGLTYSQQSELLKAYKGDLSQLSAVFPQFSMDEIEREYQMNSRNVDMTITALLCKPIVLNPKQNFPPPTLESAEEKKKLSTTVTRMANLKPIFIEPTPNTVEKNTYGVSQAALDEALKRIKMSCVDEVIVKNDEVAEKEEDVKADSLSVNVPDIILEEKEEVKEVVEKPEIVEPTSVEGKDDQIENVAVVDIKEREETNEIVFTFHINPEERFSNGKVCVVDYYDNSLVKLEKEFGMATIFEIKMKKMSGLYRIQYIVGDLVTVLRDFSVDPVKMQLSVESDFYNISFSGPSDEVLSRVSWVGVFPLYGDKKNNYITYANTKGMKVGSTVQIKIGKEAGGFICRAFAQENSSGGFIGFGKSYFTVGDSNEVLVTKAN